ncbi:MAG: SurA N-terminal domain-containing protein [Candidatus Schekmanbacteria bacterium]|nr:SurA N-terminal domain-containing protein [Candidatus Schekmanbacteria bacterium]
MLDFMRKNVKSFGVKLILTVIIGAFVGTIFLVWGMGERGKRDIGNFAAKVDKNYISIARFEQNYNLKKRLYSNIYKEKFTPQMEKEINLRQKVLDELVDRTLVIQQAEKENLSVGDDEVKNRIKSYPSFQKDGVFNAALYKDLLKFNRMSPQQFEEEQRQDLLVEKMSNIIKDQAKASRAEILEEYHQRNEKIKVKFILFDPNKYVEQITPTQEEINTYFSQHRPEYEKAGQRKVKYLFLNIQNLEPGQISAEAVKNYYETHKDKYHRPKQVKASHILLKLTPELPQNKKDEIKNKAKGLLERIRKNEDFAKLAIAFSEDPGSAKMGGDLGYFGPGRMVPAFETAAFSLPVGQVSDLVETPYGYHIIKVFDIREERTAALEEVAESIQFEIKREQSQTAADELADDIYLKLSENTVKWQEVEQRGEWEEVTADFFTQKEGAPGAASDLNFRDVAFKLAGNEISAPVKISGGRAIIQVIEKKEPYLPELAEVKDKVIQDVKKEKALQTAKDTAASALEKFRQGTTFDKLAEGVEVKESDLVNRRGFIREIGVIAKFSQELFTLGQGQVSQPILLEGSPDKKYALFFLAEKQAAEDAKITAEEEGQIHTQLLSVKHEMILQNWLASLRKEAKIEINPRMVN